MQCAICLTDSKPMHTTKQCFGCKCNVAVHRQCAKQWKVGKCFVCKELSTPISMISRLEEFYSRVGNVEDDITFFGMIKWCLVNSFFFCNSPVILLVSLLERLPADVYIPIYNLFFVLLIVPTIYFSVYEWSLMTIAVIPTGFFLLLITLVLESKVDHIMATEFPEIG